MRTRQAIFMSKVADNSTPKMILGACWGVRVQSLTIPHQAAIPHQAWYFQTDYRKKYYSRISG